MGFYAKPKEYCNETVDSRDGLNGDDLCLFPVKWKVVYSWGTRYYCTLHKNRNKEGSIKIISMGDVKKPDKRMVS
jgi:hypothetical protein